MMSSLSELLANIYKLPPEELLPGTPESERPNEMALHEQVVPAAEVRHMRECGIGFKRACFIREVGGEKEKKKSSYTEMKMYIFREEVGHMLVATFSSTETKVEHAILGRETNLVPISTAEELHEYVLSITGHMALDTT